MVESTTYEPPYIGYCVECNAKHEVGSELEPEERGCMCGGEIVPESEHPRLDSDDEGSGSGWGYAGITSYEIGGPGGERRLTVERVRTVQTHPATTDHEGGHRAVWLNEGYRVCPPEGGLPEFEGHSPRDFERVGVVSNHRDPPAEGLVYAESSPPEGEMWDDESVGPRWYWVPFDDETFHSVGGPAGEAHPQNDSEPVDLSVWLDEDMDDASRRGAAEGLTEVLEERAQVERVNNCVVVRAEQNGGGGEGDG